MVAREFNSVAELAKYIDQQAKKVLQQQESNVKNVVVHELIESIDENIYPKYQPRQYDRLMDEGGLTDRDNFAVEKTADGVAISSSRKGHDRSGAYVDVMEIIEGNKEYSIPDTYGYGYEEPRHAVEPAREKLRNSGSLKKAFKLDLLNNGINVE